MKVTERWRRRGIGEELIVVEKERKRRIKSRDSWLGKQ